MLLGIAAQGHQATKGDGGPAVSVEKVLSADRTLAVPACVDGLRACPPEDCGGTGGFEELLQILADPGHPEHRERREWMSRDYAPAVFDVSEFEDSLRQAELAAFDDDWA